MCVWELCGQVAVRRGAARAYDHAQLVNQQWLEINKLGLSALTPMITLQIYLPVRICVCLRAHPVPPPRCFAYTQEFKVMHYMRATEVPAKLCAAYARPDTWEVLQERWRLS